jgi:hypothetical protein
MRRSYRSKLLCTDIVYLLYLKLKGKGSVIHIEKQNHKVWMGTYEEN